MSSNKSIMSVDLFSHWIWDYNLYVVKKRTRYCLYVSKRRPARKKKQQLEIATQRINYLMKLADQSCVDGNLELSNSCTKLVRNIGMKYNVRLSSDARMKICRSCNSYLNPSTSRRRLATNKTISITCDSCDRTYRFPYSQK